MDEFDDALFLPEKAMRKAAIGLARAFLAGEGQGHPAAMRARGEKALGRQYGWLPTLVLHLHYEFGPALHAAQHDALAGAILAFPPFRAAFAAGGEPPRIRTYFPFHPPMGRPPAALGEIGLPALATGGELGDWLGLLPGELEWFAQSWPLPPDRPKLDHYRYRWVRKAHGGARLIEAPKETLRAVQRRILHGILDRVPVHAAATGCVRGRSVLDNARRHAGTRLLLKMDLRDFFISIPAARVHALFRTLGYPLETARYLTRLTTHATPARVLHAVPQEDYPSPEERRRRQDWARRFTQRHLPQGAPTSPALANLCAYRLDVRLAAAAGACRANYSRYVDDLAFSLPGGDSSQARRIRAMAEEIIVQEGFAPNRRKTRLLPASQAQKITGLLVNRHPNPPRVEYERLKAILTNCRRYGPASQNRENRPDFRAHLQGRIAWFRLANPGKGAKLEALFEHIDWYSA